MSTVQSRHVHELWNLKTTVRPSSQMPKLEDVCEMQVWQLVQVLLSKDLLQQWRLQQMTKLKVWVLPSEIHNKAYYSLLYSTNQPPCITIKPWSSCGTTAISLPSAPTTVQQPTKSWTPPNAYIQEQAGNYQPPPIAHNQQRSSNCQPPNYVSFISIIVFTTSLGCYIYWCCNAF